MVSRTPVVYLNCHLSNLHASINLREALCTCIVVSHGEWEGGKLQ